MANMHLVTGYAGQEHVTAADHGAFNAALIGTGQFVLEKGKVFEAQVISNNQIRVFDGELMMQGRFVRLNPDTYVDLTIENGTQAMLRNDLIVARYTKDTNTGVEAVNLVVIKGKPAESNPSDPEYTEGDVAGGSATMNDFPLWRIPLDGLNVGEPVSLFGEPFIDSMRTLPEIRQSVENMRGTVDGLGVLARLNEGLGNEYVWEKTSITRSFSELELTSMCWGSATYNWLYLDYADSIADDGTLINKYTVNVDNGDLIANANKVKGKYWTCRSNSAAGATGTYYTPIDADDAVSIKEGSTYYLKIEAKKYNGLAETTHGYVNSPDPSAYPIEDGYTYKALGRLGKALDGVKIATGRYKGTGTFGANNQNSLTFDFTPKVWCVFAVNDSSGSFISQGVRFLPWGMNGSWSTFSPTASTTSVGWTTNYNKNTVTWYSNNADNQGNSAVWEYHYIAIG